MINEQLALMRSFEEFSATISRCISTRFDEDPNVVKFFENKFEVVKEHSQLVSRLSRIPESDSYTPSDDIEGQSLEEIEESFRHIKNKAPIKLNRLDTSIDLLMKLEQFKATNPLFDHYIRRPSEKNYQARNVSARMQADQQSLRDFSKSDSEHQSDELLRMVPQMHHPRILVVDDVEMIRYLLTRQLEDVYSIDCAEDGVEALKKLETNAYDIVLSDMMMPNMDGKKLYEQFSENPEISKRFIFHTAYSGEPDDFFKNNNLPVIQKPSSRNEILEVISEKLQQIYSN
jgi:CheY-like chemotaxis protein